MIKGALQVDFKIAFRFFFRGSTPVSPFAAKKQRVELFHKKAE